MILDKLLKRKKLEPWEEWPPRPNDDPKTFAMHGDSWWGNSITLFPKEQPEEPNTCTVVGWTTPRPSPGDYLVLKCTSGKWGRFVFTKIDLKNDPHDMWFGTAVGPHEYVDEPKTKSATEFIQREYRFGLV